MDFVSNDIYTEGMVKIRIDAVGGDLDRIAFKYPTSFMNEMARQLTSAIESATGVEGIADSSVELIMMFAGSTYMEHISGNVTYRRLMLIDAVSAPRDFWIKWTKLENCDGEYSAQNILFELGEDVEQKIREREYRYLLTSGKDKYHNSMGRKKVTEWREVIKRAARRGELTKVESDFELAPETLELEERIADLLGKRIESRNQPAKEEIPYITPEDDEFARAMAKARLVVESAAEETEEVTLAELADEICEAAEMAEEIELEAADEAEDEEIEIEIVELDPVEEPKEIVEEEPVATIQESPAAEDIFELVDESEGEFDIFEDTEDEAEFEELDIFDEEAPAELVFDDEPEIKEELEIEEPEIAEPIIEEAPVAEPVIVEEVAEKIVVEEPVVEESIEEPVIEEEPIVAEPIVEEATVAEPVAEKPEITSYEHTTQQISIADRVADIRAELETKIRLEYESRARMKAEQENIELRRELERVRTESEVALAEARAELEMLRVEYERLLEETEQADLARAAEDSRRRAEEAQLRAQIEAQLRHEAGERERLAEAARMAIEEQHRLEAENARIARQREEEERLEAERIRKIEEEKAIEAARQAEMERIRRENEEAKARAKAAMPDMSSSKYAYTSKTVKLVFRRSVDPNITSRIQEIIKATVDYYGKDNVYLRIRATVPDSQTVLLEFAEIPLEEMELLGNIIKILGNSGLGIAKAIID